VVSTLIGLAALLASILWRSAFIAGGGRNKPFKKMNHATAAMCIDDPLQHHESWCFRLNLSVRAAPISIAPSAIGPQRVRAKRLG
jgi:hypothetical protein